MARLFFVLTCVVVGSTGALAQKPEPPKPPTPKIAVRSAFHYIDPNPIEWIYTVDITFAWDARHCDFVYIHTDDGSRRAPDDRRHPVRGRL